MNAWDILKSHQEKANQLGYGVEWAELCAQKTSKAANNAMTAATLKNRWAAFAAIDAGLLANQEAIIERIQEAITKAEA